MDKVKVKSKREWEWLWFLLVLSLAFFCFAAGSAAQTRRALLVGIDEYHPGKNPPSPCRKNRGNLYGCVNDAKAMAGLLASKYDFKTENIHVLLNENATRATILAYYERYLVNEAGPGDICVFYFSGHGSQVKNSKAEEPDKMDESLVPCDSWRGAPDLRDKELKKSFNRTLDKKAQLTVIVDACHSGSIARGIPAPLRYRSLPANECDAADPPGNDADPAQRGALIFSATQDFDLASEIEDENNNSHGLFTWALLHVLSSASNDEPAHHILLKVKAVMQGEGRPQEPNLEGPPAQRRNPLFGFKPGDRSRVTAAVIRVDKDAVLLQGGIAAGIRENCVLKKITGKNRSDGIRIQVIAVTGLNRCSAKPVQGDAKDLRKGDLFALERWAAAPSSRLKACLPGSTIPLADLTRLAREMARLRNSGGIDWIADPTVTNPTHRMSWNDPGWCLHTPAQVPVHLGKNPSAAEVLEQIRLNPAGKNTKPGFFLQLPLSAELYNTARTDMTDCAAAIEIVSPSQETNYVLVGRFNGEKIEYAWVLPNMTGAKEQAPALPVRTDWMPVEKEGLRRPGGSFEKPPPGPPQNFLLGPGIIHQLKDKIVRLAMIKAWLQLSAPPDNGGFPYRLALKNARTNAVTVTGPLVQGETYGPVLRAEPGKLAGKIEKRYVYVFTIDSYGKGQLLFPLTERLNAENRFPVEDRDFPVEIRLGRSGLFTVEEPLGTDTYILLTTVEPLANPEVLSFSGVRRAVVKGRSSPLERLLAGVGLKRSANPPVTPINWSIERLSILSKKQKVNKGGSLEINKKF